MRRYESVVILDPEVPDDDIAAFTAKYGELIKTSGGEIIKIEDWGYKRLAYIIKKKERGRYILFDFVGIPSLINELERQFKISEDVLKFLSVKLDDEVDLEAFKSKPEEAQETPAPEASPETDETPAPEASASAPEAPSAENAGPSAVAPAEAAQPDAATEAAEEPKSDTGTTPEGTPSEEAPPAQETVKEGE
jgi:small subunit ribosomal protein S6